jgi:hypothetical protein
MDKKNLLLTAAIIFGIVSIVHILISVFKWYIQVGNFQIPLYFSYIAAAVAGYMSWSFFKILNK